MAEQQRKAPDRPAAERYFTEYVDLTVAGSTAEVALQEAINDKAGEARLEADQLDQVSER